MNKQELLALGLTEEQTSKVLDGFKDSIPYSRFKEAIDEKNELKNQLSERDNQLKELAKITKDNEDLNSKIKELQDTNKNTQTEYENRLASLRLDNGIEVALTKAGANNNKAVKALLNLDNIKYENNKLVGLDEQLKALRESDAYLFKQTGETPTPSGFNPQKSGDNNGQSKLTWGNVLKEEYNK